MTKKQNLKEDLINIINKGNANDLDNFLVRLAKSHRTVLKYVDNKKYGKEALENKTIILMKVKKLNDFKDQRNLQNITKNIYLSCQSYGKEESVAMWYIYSGHKGEGCIIKYPSKCISNFVENPKSIKCFNTKNKKYIILGPKDYSIYYKDIIYKSNITKTYSTNNIVVNASKTYKTLEKNRNIKQMIKNYAWRYEKETRLIVVIKKALSDKYDAIEIKIDCKDTDIKLIQHPNDKSKEQLFIPSDLKNSMNIKPKY